MDMDFEQYLHLKEYFNGLKLVKIAIDYGIKPADMKNIEIIPSYVGATSMLEIFDNILSILFKTEYIEPYGTEYENFIEDLMKNGEFTEIGRNHVQTIKDTGDLYFLEINSPDLMDFPIGCLDWSDVMAFVQTSTGIVLCCGIDLGEPELDLPLKEIMSFYTQKHMSGVK